MSDLSYSESTPSLHKKVIPLGQKEIETPMTSRRRDVVGSPDIRRRGFLRTSLADKAKLVA